MIRTGIVGLTGRLQSPQRRQEAHDRLIEEHGRRPDPRHPVLGEDRQGHLFAALTAEHQESRSLLFRIGRIVGDPLGKEVLGVGQHRGGVQRGCGFVNHGSGW